MMEKESYKLRDIFFMIWKMIPFYAIGIVGITLVEAFLPAVQTVAVAWFVDAVTEYLKDHQSLRQVLSAVISIIICQFCTVCLPTLRDTVSKIGQQKLAILLKPMMIKKRARLEYRYVEDDETWDLIMRVSETPEDQVMDVYNNILNIVCLAITVISLLMIILRYSPAAGLGILIISVPFYRIAMRTGKKNYEMYRRQKKIERRYDYLEEILTDREYVEERTLFSFTPAIVKEYESLFKRMYKIEKQIQKRSFVNLKSGSVTSLFLALILIGLLGLSLYHGSLSAGLFISLTTATINLVQIMSWQLSDVMFSLAQVKEFCGDLTAFMALEEKEGATDQREKKGKLKIRSIEFKDVTFCYPGTETRILDHCSFKMTEGKNYALVGENGAGKTTVTKLLLGLYDNYTGQILINGTELKEYPYADIKGAFSAVCQDSSHYEVSIRENILLGDIGTEDEERMKNAINKSRMSSVIENCPDGLDTNLGRLHASGRDLSGGEWQRLAIARLLYAGAQVNILDEPTSALDPLQESALYKLFHEVSKNVFTIFITHRLGAARVADCILVMQKGHIVECGSHEELMGIPEGNYRKMYEVQKSWYE